ncbi:MAG TPA: hypothetical protein VMT00_08110 [Thermoanaerobaculia bacterium]|nr:hypothetical protein [Thermoanaerobaculia bacterium]
MASGHSINQNERMALDRLARSPSCPRCDLDKTLGMGLCRKCRTQLPQHMRQDIESIEKRDPQRVLVAMKAAASYFQQHFRSIRDFGGGRKK